MENKEIRLHFEWDKAPEKLKQSAKAVNDCHKSVMKLHNNLEKVSAELTSENRKLEQAQREFSQQLKAWVPENV